MCETCTSKLPKLQLRHSELSRRTSATVDGLLDDNAAFGAESTSLKARAEGFEAEYRKSEDRLHAKCKELNNLREAFQQFEYSNAAEVEKLVTERVNQYKKTALQPVRHYKELSPRSQPITIKCSSCPEKDKLIITKDNIIATFKAENARLSGDDTKAYLTLKKELKQCKANLLASETRADKL